MARKVNYHEQSFWEQRYKQNICEWMEWLATPNQIAEILKKHLPQSSKILELGCGTSNLCEKLTTMSHQVICVDFSKEVIKNRNRNNKNDKIAYKFHNIVEKMPFQDEEFDVVIEKNTLDCLFCQQNYLANIFRCMKDCYRVIKTGGKMISITHGKQKNRHFFYRTKFSPFNLQVIPLIDKKPNQAQILIFILTKGEKIEKDNSQQMIEDQEDNFNIQQNQGNEQDRQKEQNQQNENQENIKQQNQQLEQKGQNQENGNQQGEQQQGQNQQEAEQQENYQFQQDES